MPGEDGGSPHINVGGDPDPEMVIDEVFILIATHPNGGEGIYGHSIADNMHWFVAQDRALKDELERFLRDRGAIEVCRRQGVKLEWRRYVDTKFSDDHEVIT